MSRRVYRLLALCARAICETTHYELLERAAAGLAAWEQVPAQAEAHGMAPLLYVHLKSGGIELPLAIKRQLQGLYLRHRDVNRICAGVLREIVSALQDASIQALVLKGGALAHLVYPEPGLRPMSDLDILVPISELWRAQSILIDLGFANPSPVKSMQAHRHLAAVTLHTEGLDIKVELHHKLFSNYFDHATFFLRSKMSPPFSKNVKMGQPELPLPSQPFALEEQTAYTLGYEEMLAHICQHLASHVNVWDYARLIWVADIVSLAEGFASEIDWKWIQRQYPLVLGTLSLVHFLTPLSDELLSTASIKIGREPQGIGVEYQGWPQIRGVGWRERGYRHVLHSTLFPSEWWLRLRYQLGSARPLFWCRWLRHPLYILGHVARVGLERLGWPTPVQLATGRRPS